MSLLETIHDPALVRDLDAPRLETLAEELRRQQRIDEPGITEQVREALGIRGLQGRRRRRSGVDAA
jgi:hypothetical protein